MLTLLLLLSPLLLLDELVVLLVIGATAVEDAMLEISIGKIPVIAADVAAAEANAA